MMKRLVCALALLVQTYPSPGPGRQATTAPAAISMVQSVAPSGTGTQTATFTFASNVTSGHAAMCYVMWPAVGQTVTLSDTLGTTFTQQAAVEVNTASEYIYIYSGSFASSGADTITYHLSFAYSHDIETGECYELSNVGSPFLDSSVGSAVGTGTGGLTATSSITPGSSSDTIYSVFGWIGAGATLNVASPFTVSAGMTGPFDGSQSADAFATPHSMSSLDANWTGTTGLTGTNSWAAVVIAIKGP